MNINELIKVISTKDNLSFILGKHVGTVHGDDDKVIGQLAISHNYSTIMFVDAEDNYFKVDTEKFVEYVLANKKELLNDYHNNNSKNGEENE